MTELEDLPVALARGLIRCPSVTPVDAGALDLLEETLAPAGFRCHRLLFSDEGTPDVDNLYARDRDPPASSLLRRTHRCGTAGAGTRCGSIRPLPARSPTACSMAAAPRT